MSTNNTLPELFVNSTSKIKCFKKALHTIDFESAMKFDRQFVLCLLLCYLLYICARVVPIGHNLYCVYCRVTCCIYVHVLYPLDTICTAFIAVLLAVYMCTCCTHWTQFVLRLLLCYLLYICARVVPIGHNLYCVYCCVTCCVYVHVLYPLDTIP